MMLSLLRNQKGIALITVYMTSVFLVVISGAAFSKSFFEFRQVEREVTRIQSYAAAEAGLQSALTQIGQNAYTGFINTNAIDVPNFQAIDGTPVGNFTVNIAYPNQADWVILQSTGTASGETRNLEGRVFLDSNFSKYLVYSNTANFNSGDNAQYGNHNGVDPEGVPSNEDDRAAMYFTGDWTTSGTNVHMYGDVHAGDEINGNNSSQVHGDTYAGDFILNAQGDVHDTGVNGNLVVGDGFDDDFDRNDDTIVDEHDYPDFHDLTVDGADDSHAEETLVEIDHGFYSANNSIPVFSAGAAQNRYIEFQVPPGATSSTVVEYETADFQTVKQTHNLPHSAIVYVKGDVYVKGQIEGRVSVVSSDDIFLDGNVSYTNGQATADATHSTAFLAKDKLYFRPNQLEVSGILYAENSSGSSAAFDSDYNLDGAYDPWAKERLRLYGNRVIEGSTNLSNYGDRVYGYDQNLKYFRPPGLPVRPVLRLVREA